CLPRFDLLRVAERADCGCDVSDRQQPARSTGDRSAGWKWRRRHISLPDTADRVDWSHLGHALALTARDRHEDWIDSYRRTVNRSIVLLPDVVGDGCRNSLRTH